MSTSTDTTNTWTEWIGCRERLKQGQIILSKPGPLSDCSAIRKTNILPDKKWQDPSPKILITGAADKYMLLKNSLYFEGKQHRVDSVDEVSLDTHCGMWCYWGQITCDYSYIYIGWWQLRSEPYWVRNHRYKFIHCCNREGKICTHTNVRCVINRESKYGTSVICLYR